MATETFVGLDLRTMQVTLEGISPLIAHAWSEKAKKAMRDKQQKAATKGKEAKDPQADFLAAQYRLPDGSHAFPVVAFKSSVVSAGVLADMRMTLLRKAFHVNLGQEFVAIQHDAEPTMREDTVRVGMGAADLRYRPEYSNWRVALKVTYNARAVSREQLIALFDIAGFSVGVGEWRPEKDGQFGMFRVASVEGV
jgi:hypothetical protein